MRRNLSTGTWASIGEQCLVRYRVDGSDLAHVMIGEDDQSIELTFNAEGLRQLLATSSKAVTEMDALAKQEEAGWDGRERQAAEQSA